MANIRGLNDIRDSRGGGADRRGILTGAGNSFLLGANGQLKDPREETFFDMLRFNICPQLTFYSFAVIFSFLLTGMFFAQVGVDGLNRKKIIQEFLPINPQGPLTGHLSDNYNEIRENKHLWRFATALLIHSNAYHLFSNVLSLIIWASYFETFISSKRMLFNFCIAGRINRYYRECLRSCFKRTWI